MSLFCLVTVGKAWCQEQEGCRHIHVADQDDVAQLALSFPFHPALQSTGHRHSHSDWPTSPVKPLETPSHSELCIPSESKSYQCGGGLTITATEHPAVQGSISQM